MKNREKPFCYIRKRHYLGKTNMYKPQEVRYVEETQLTEQTKL